MKFSVLLSVYNKEKPLSLKQCFDSLLSQTLLPNEIILVKDGPLNSELEKIISIYTKKNSIIKVVSLEKNLGLGKALNEGLKHCSFDLIARMDTDDISKPNRFEKQIEVFQNNPEIDVCSAWIEEFEDDLNHILSTKRLPEKHEDIKQYAKSRCPINHPVAMFKKKSVINAGGYLHFPLYEDYYLWIRMLKNGARFYNIQESLLYFRISPDMFKRRGGLKYAITEFRFQKLLLKMDMISIIIFFKNVIIRFPIRIAPNFIRSIIYKKILR